MEIDYLWLVIWLYALDLIFAIIAHHLWPWTQRAEHHVLRHVNFVPTYSSRSSHVQELIWRSSHLINHLSSSIIYVCSVLDLVWISLNAHLWDSFASVIAYWVHMLPLVLKTLPLELTLFHKNCVPGTKVEFVSRAWCSSSCRFHYFRLNWILNLILFSSCGMLVTLSISNWNQLISTIIYCLTLVAVNMSVNNSFSCIFWCSHFIIWL